ncbi:interferon alpha/beta receptor 2 [Bombina bombina]|uniref:interferon alpha/beta receptor 2 n=1 Tax=Bombina bombina TaxID=8345 RepID=UPI00235A796E|nr:interferon alpha/beta receptor 2 [Bombina bombina]
MLQLHAALLQICHLILMVSSIQKPPKNVRLISENFQHNLTWEDERSESSTYYSVWFKKDTGHWYPVKECSNLTIWFCELTDYFTDLHGTYVAGVKSFRNNDTSNFSLSKELIPLESTQLGPPIVHVSACENAINLTIQPPVSHIKSSNGKSTQSMLNKYVYPLLTYTINVVQPNKIQQQPMNQKEEAFQEIYATTIPNLIPNTNYCVSVAVSAIANLHTNPIPSAFQCILTKSSPKADITDKSYIIGAVIGGIVLLIGLIIILIALDRAGYLCMNIGFFPKVLKSVPKASHSGLLQINENICSAYAVPVTLINKLEDQKENEEDSCDQGYAQRKTFLDNAESDVTGGDTSALSFTPASSSAESSGQVCDSVAEEAIHKVQPLILDNNDSCPANAVDFKNTSKLSFNSNSVFNINLNSVLVGNPEDLWTGFKKHTSQRNDLKTSPVLQEHGSALAVHKPTILSNLLSLDATGILSSQESISEDYVSSESGDASDADEHIVSGYMRRGS